MADFGAHLKAARESQGISLRQIADATKISVGALEALERSDFSRLPGGIFSRAFVRAYAIQVGLDPEQTVETFLEEYGRADVQPDTGPRPEVTADDRAFLARQQRAARLLRWGLIALLLLAGGGIVAWRYRVRSAPPSESVPPATSQTEGPPPAQAAAPVLPPVAAPAGPAPAPAPPQADQIAVHLEITADCWVRASIDGTTALEQTLHAGDQRDFKANGDIYLQVGNSGAVKWTINGRDAKDLGNPGQPAYAHVTRATLDKFLK